MAIFNCPECGGQVSTSADHCVHCGWEFTFCPECGKIYAGKHERCLNCGFNIHLSNEEGTNVKSSSKIKEQSFNESVLENDNIVDVWKKQSSVDNTLLKCIKFGTIVLELLMTVFCIVGIIEFLGWKNKESFDMILEVNSLKENIKTYIILIAIFYVLSKLLVNVREIYIRKKCMLWCESKAFDLVNYTKKYIKTFTESSSKNYNAIITMAYIKNQPNKITYYYLNMIMTLIFAVVASCLVGIGAYKSIGSYIDSIILDSLQIKVEYALLIIGVALIFIGFIVDFVINEKVATEATEWIKK